MFIPKSLKKFSYKIIFNQNHGKNNVSKSCVNLIKNLKFTSANVQQICQIYNYTTYTIVDIRCLRLLYKFARLAFIESFCIYCTNIWKVHPLIESDAFLPYNSNRTTWMRLNFRPIVSINCLRKERCGLQFTCFSVAQKEIGIFFLDIG